MIQKKMECKKCGLIKAINKYGDDRFYCVGCGKNLGCRNITKKEREKE